MSLSINRLLIAGNLTKEPETKPVGKGTLCIISIAVNRKYKGKDGAMVEEVSYIDVDCWGYTADNVAKYLHTGSGVLIEGRLKSDDWKTKDGSARRSLKVVADSVQFTDGKPSAVSAVATKPADGDDW